MACCSENQSWDFLDPNPIHQSVDIRPRTTVPQPASSGHGQHTSPRTPGLQTLALPTSRPTPALGHLGSQSRVLGSRAISCGLTEALGPPRAPQPEHLGASATHQELALALGPGPTHHQVSISSEIPDSLASHSRIQPYLTSGQHQLWDVLAPVSGTGPSHQH